MSSSDTARGDAYAREMIKNDKLGVLYQERQDRDARELQKVQIQIWRIFFCGPNLGGILKNGFLELE